MNCIFIFSYRNPFLNLILVLIFASFPILSFAQSGDRLETIDKHLSMFKDSGFLIDQPVTISFDGSLREFVLFLGETTKLNLLTSPSINNSTSLSFSNAKIRDIILYLCLSYSLDLRLSGGIIEFVPYIPPNPIPIIKTPIISYNKDDQLFDLNLKNDTLFVVTNSISAYCGKNIVLSSGVRNLLLNGFIVKSDAESTLKQIALNNNLILKKENDYFKIDAAPIQNQQGISRTSQDGTNLAFQRIGGNNHLSINARNVSIRDIIEGISTDLGINYYLLPDKSGESSTTNLLSTIISVQSQDISYTDLLNTIFSNTNIGYKIEQGVYFFGPRNSESLQNYRVFQFQNRTARGTLTLTPKNLLYEINIDTMMELNSLIISGPIKNIDRLVQFYETIDQLIPVILIDVLVVDVSINKLSDIGIEAGLKKGGATSGGQIISGSSDKGGIDFSFSPKAINNILGLLEGQGVTNLGRVSSNFYLSLRAVQEAGVVDVKFTPKLSTLNSHKAKLSIGQKRYYQEQQVTYPGSDRPIPIQANIFREIEANIDLEITPIVSGDEQITLDLYFEDTEFQGTSTINAPPPQVSRKFESKIRVKNGEMVVLGGLERESSIKSRRGLPWLSKIPLLGWLFGRSSKTKEKGKLLIFIKPTIVN